MTTAFGELELLVEKEEEEADAAVGSDGVRLARSEWRNRREIILLELLFVLQYEYDCSCHGRCL